MIQAAQGYGLLCDIKTSINAPLSHQIRVQQMCTSGCMNENIQWSVEKKKKPSLLPAKYATTEAQT